MKKYKVEVRLCSEYEIEIDEIALGGDEFIEHFKRYFAELDDWEEHAVNVATMKARGFTFIEGYGAPLVKGKRQPFVKDEETTAAINIVPIYEEDVEVDCFEVRD